MNKPRKRVTWFIDPELLNKVARASLDFHDGEGRVSQSPVVEAALSQYFGLKRRDTPDREPANSAT